MEPHIIIFLSIVIFSFAMGIIGIWRKIPLTMFIGGALIAFLAIMTDNIIMNDRIDNIVATESTFNITGSVTEIPDYKYNVITGSMLSTIRADGANIHSRGEHITSTSVLIGEVIECINYPLLKSGSPTGTVEFGVMSPTNLMVKTFGSMSIAGLTTDMIYYEFCLPNGEGYTIQSGDYIGARWLTFGVSDASNFIRTVRDASNAFDGTNTVLSDYVTSWTDTTTQDINMQLYTMEEIPNNVQVSGIGGIYSYEDNSIPLDPYAKILFGLIGAIIMLAGALIWKTIED